MKYDMIIIGAGIVGLATALQIKKKRPSSKLLVLDKEAKIAAHQTGHNSGVIHSGLYYKPGSLKATNCIEGYHLLVDFCRKNDIDFELPGKIVVATSNDEVPLMENLHKRGEQNGLKGIKKLSAEEIREYEPHISGVAALYVPQTGIVDYVKIAEKYAELIEQGDGEIMLGEKVENINTQGKHIVVETPKNSYHCDLIVNCSGLYSDKVAKLTDQETSFKIIPFRGEYYKLKKEKEHLINNLVYPVPDPNFPFLGVHFTRMAEGGVEAGPNAVLAFRREGYTKSDINISELAETLAWPGFQKVAFKYWKTGLGELYRSFSKAAFTKALQKLLPELQENDLEPGGAGVRAQACDKDGGLIDDFLILENEYAVNVCNAPSPAATSSLSIGNTVADRVLKRFN